jgi:hypothetical protein
MGQLRASVTKGDSEGRKTRTPIKQRKAGGGSREDGCAFPHGGAKVSPGEPWVRLTRLWAISP